MGALQGHKRIALARASNTREDSEALWLANGFPSHMVYVPFKQLEFGGFFFFFTISQGWGVYPGAPQQYPSLL